jgi:Ca2+-binding RTX toxin-like protein
MAISTSNVTATVGGSGHNISLNFDGKDLATYYATALTNGLVLDPATEPDGPSVGTVPYLVVPVAYSGSSVVSGSGYDSIIIGSTTHAVTLTGGGVADPVGQTVIASDGGLDFTASDSTNEKIIAGGGNNDISLAGSSGSNQVYLSAGSNTIVAGSGPTSIDAGIGANSIFAGSGGTRIAVEGRDSIQLAGGVSSVYVGAYYGGPDVASALVYGATNPAIVSTIYFEGDGLNASTVFGGTSGSDIFNVGAGGGYFMAGSGGNSKLYGGSGAVTLVGGGDGDYLVGGTSGADSLNAGNGKVVIVYAKVSGDTLTGGSSPYSSAIFQVAGADTVNLGAGAATVAAGPAYDPSTGTLASVDISHAYITDGTGTLLFEGGANASTVTSGAGAETIFANAGGGVFTGGTDGNNLMIGGVHAGDGAVTLTAAGNGNYLQGSADGGDQLNGGSGTNVAIVTQSSETKGDLVNTGSGNDTVDLLGGQDTVNIGSGQTTVNVSTGTSVNGGLGSLYFVGGSAASTVIGGAGTETIFGNAGGGYFTAGPYGGNVLIGGTGAATMVGGGSGDYLEGYSGPGGPADLLKAGTGNETLVAGTGADTLVGDSTGSDVFSFVYAAANQSYTINSFHVGPTSSDTLYFLNSADEQAALNSYTTVSGSGVMTLADGTKITLTGYTGSINGHTGSL